MKVELAVGILVCVMAAQAWDRGEGGETWEEEEERYTNAWMAEIHGGEDVAKRVARDLGFKYEEKAVPFENHYIFTRDDHPEVSSSHSGHLTTQLVDIEEVRWAKQQTLMKP